MRIVGGAWKGRPLAGPSGDGGAERLRPTSDRMREAIFNILAHGDWPPLEGARVLDLFAGTGALGFEALSRGAARALFVDEGAQARALVRRNIEAFSATGMTKLYRRDATRLGENRDAPYDFVFLDPPYGRGLGPKALASAHAGGWLAAGAVGVLERGAGEDEALPEGFALVSSRVYGEGRVAFVRAPGMREEDE